MISLEEIKSYLRVDGSEEDELIQKMMDTAQNLCRDVARRDTLGDSSAMRMAMLYTTAYLYENREEADHHALLLSLRALLMGERKAGF